MHILMSYDLNLIFVNIQNEITALRGKNSIIIIFFGNIDNIFWF